MQHTSHLLMIRPVSFGFNKETAVNNSFQVESKDEAVQSKAAAEFDAFAGMLVQHGIDVTVVNDTPAPHTPDSIFPNNWISFHDNGAICLYPMFAANRRMERKEHVLDAIRSKFDITETVDLTGHESDHLFLEGTGSMVLDRDHRIAYACLSPRTDEKIVAEWCDIFGYRPVGFTATDAHGKAIYHTNVMMCVADRYAVICTASITDPPERKKVTDALTQTGKTVIDIDIDQMNHFAGNMLQVNNDAGKTFLVMSSSAYQSLTPQQLRQIETFNPVLHADIASIETDGGGSARCMMAEIFLPLKSK